ncbi:MAG: hypothetical protein WCS42_03280 [Verrucomicrobiota bacterium]
MKTPSSPHSSGSPRAAAFSTAALVSLMMICFLVFTGSVQTWPVQAGPDGLINVWDDFTDLGSQPA